MKSAEIIELYRKMGIGSEKERERFLKWTDDPKQDERDLQTFIIETPNSNPLEVTEHAKLAPDSE